MFVTYHLLPVKTRSLRACRGTPMAARRLFSPVSGGLRQAVKHVRRWQVWNLANPLRSYVLGVDGLAACAIGLAVARTRWQTSHVLVAVALIACGIVAIESTRTVREAHGEVVRDLQSVWFLATAIALPPAFALLAPFPLMAYKLWRVPRLVVYRRVFSNATLSLAYGCASVVFHAIPGSTGGSMPGAGIHALTWTASVAACGLLGWLVNLSLLVGAIRLSDPTASVRQQMGSRESITSDLLELSLAVSLTLVVAINPVLMALALPSVVLCRRSIMRAQLVTHARIDAKTGLLNAGTWQREAEVEFFRALRRRTSLAIAMVDIDHFKSVIDSVGPLVADQLIRDIAEMLRDQLPSHELIGRFSGKEFAILLPQTGRAEAKRISERLRDHIAGEPIAVESGTQAGFVFRLTVSIGVAVLNESRRALADLIGAADSALGQAKSTGWNKVCVLSDDLEENGESPGGLASR
jgi:diguanylate cyclase (GGDEF)-like protein